MSEDKSKLTDGAAALDLLTAMSAKELTAVLLSGAQRTNSDVNLMLLAYALADLLGRQEDVLGNMSTLMVKSEMLATTLPDQDKLRALLSDVINASEKLDLASIRLGEGSRDFINAHQATLNALRSVMETTANDVIKQSIKTLPKAIEDELFKMSKAKISLKILLAFLMGGGIGVLSLLYLSGWMIDKGLLPFIFG
ncbi:hypothetical protein [Aeromonas hydrophila]|uniref:hypothetical protein n=1 Tax=Aeromonas hydrophila TaxID=644 RepID=UPI002B48D184|nr:hypothetical protein [Aeromonas hydrophila]